MKQLINLLFTIPFYSSFVLGNIPQSSVIYPVFDAKELMLPENLRVIHDVSVNKFQFNVLGLEDLRISGSAQFSEKAFVEMITSLSISPEKLIILDLREESHGFINGMPVSWMDKNNFSNADKKVDEIENDERDRLAMTLQEKSILINPFQNSIEMDVSTVQTERELTEKMGATYIRLPVTDHKYPSNEVLEQFIELIKTLPSDYWIHIHCKGGKGRTTTFLALFDIAKNAKQVDLEDILARQYFIGGIDLTDVEKKNEERSNDAKQRLRLIENFYRYCKESSDL